MRKLGSNSEFALERDDALMRAFRQEMAQCNHIRIDELAQRVVHHSCPRFWVSEERAAAVVARMLRGEASLCGMFPAKRRMFEEIFARFEDLKRNRPRASIYSLVSEVVNQPAPEFYMSPRRVRDIIIRIINKR